MKRFYDCHQEEIERDYKEIGGAKTAKKWQMRTSTLHGVLNRWLCSRKPRTPAPAFPGSPSSFPRLPDFNESWPEEVMLRWLSIWLYLVVHAPGEEP